MPLSGKACESGKNQEDAVMSTGWGGGGILGKRADHEDSSRTLGV